MTFLEVSGLLKIYSPKGAAPVHALDGLDLAVPQGTIRLRRVVIHPSEAQA